MTAEAARPRAEDPIVKRFTEAVRRSVRRFSLIVTVALLVAAVYLAYWGIIGLRTWA